jgi:phosphoglycolate phosphatase-like HAD superfamily hydrolase
MTQALLFDLDGTLIDSSDDLTRALARTSGAVDRPRRSGVDREGIANKRATPSCGGLRSSVGLF